ncbi:MAG: hypothetical protein DI586_08780 [Micavibrio aeruginosavorus]|uniref:Uncharacterized protein n=1 Tax=Micavibrio aeruginosavorus TaxID=349221 RepID=A0A2W5H9Q6_9BACT|nr:MAG: hypothetical protein DI586_08780 [Micavibrio aeruginosavorus]
MKPNLAIISRLKEKVISYQSIIFQQSLSLDLNKLDPESSLYDPEYERSVRKKEAIYISIVEAVLKQKGIESKSFRILCKIEQNLFSAEFYRALIFGGVSNNKSTLKQFYRALDEDIFLLKSMSNPADYSAAINDLGLKGIAPKKLKNLITSLEAMSKKSRDLIVKGDGLPDCG